MSFFSVLCLCSLIKDEYTAYHKEAGDGIYMEGAYGSKGDEGYGIILE